MYPFTFFDNSAATAEPRLANVGKAKNSTRIPLVYDGIWMHAMSPRAFILRHGKTNVKRPQDRQCNMVFLDGHAESIARDDLILEVIRLANRLGVAFSGIGATVTK